MLSEPTPFVNDDEPSYCPLCGGFLSHQWVLCICGKPIWYATCAKNCGWSDVAEKVPPALMSRIGETGLIGERMTTSKPSVHGVEVVCSDESRASCLDVEHEGLAYPNTGQQVKK